MAVVGRLVFSAIPVLLVLWGGVMIYRTYEGRRRAADIDEGSDTAVADARPGSGVIEVTGTARATVDDLVPATMLDTEGVVVRTVVEERAADAVGDARGTDWDTIYADGDFVPFEIDDGTGQIAVEPPEGDVSRFTVDTELYESEPGEEPPEPVQRWLDETDSLDAAVDQYRGYRQGAIEAGESVYAMGEPVTMDGNRTVLTGGDSPDEFVVSDLSKDELSDSAGYGTSSYVIGGLLLVLGTVPLAYLWVL